MQASKELFLEYIKLRYYAMKNPGQSEDEVINNFFFCNIKREWDKVSKYIIKYIVEAECFRDTNIKMTFADKMRNLFLARIHNRVETLEQYQVPQSEYHIIDEEIAKKQNPHAYRVIKFLLRLKRERQDYWKDSCWCLGNHLKEMMPDELFDPNSEGWSSFENAIKSWAHILGIKETAFIAYQLALDTQWIMGYEDIDTYFILGPGAIRGLNMIYFQEDKLVDCLGEDYYLEDNEDNKAVITKDHFTGALERVDYDSKLIELRDYINDHEWTKSEGLYIHINDIEFNLCEFNKWYSKKVGWTTTLRKYTSKEEILD